ncbi:MAG: hypothetical protein OK452_01065 [Thaumarchaeota archaeon]|nr:hypothetical protein [Nitrososphaerota archaeon]
MRPVQGVLVELAVLSSIMGGVLLIPSGLPLALYIIIAELAATYLVHCPAHYIIGRVVGIRFRRISLGRTTLARVLPARFTGLARLIPILTLSTDKASLAQTSKGYAAAMYASGTVASVSAAFVIAGVATAMESFLPAAVTWLVAIGYLMFDVVFSPKSGDIMKARAALRA